MFWNGDFAVQNSPQHDPKVLSGVPKRKRLRRALWKKYMLDELYSGVSYRAVGCEFSVSE